MNEKKKKLQDLKEENEAFQTEIDSVKKAFEDIKQESYKKLSEKSSEEDMLKKKVNDLELKNQLNEKFIRQRQYDMMKTEDKNTKIEGLLKESKTTYEKDL